MTDHEGGPLVLNVNDHVANLYMVSKMLRNAGFRVAEARTGGDALRIARAEQPEVVVLDVQLPDLSGFEVCRRLKADPDTRDIKVLHTSAALVTSSNKAQGVEAGADGYLTQPFEPQELIGAVRSLARLHATESDLIARNDALIAADRRKDEFLAMLAHELRNPLAAIKTGLPLLERHPPRDDIEARTLEVLGRQTSLLVQLVDDLLDVSRVTRSRIELHLGEVDLSRLVTQVCDGFRSRVIEPRRQRLVVETLAGPVVVAGDAGRLEQVLTNLIDNASKYSDPGTQIDVRLRLDDQGRAELTVRDRGIGIDAQTLPTVFELFAQAPASLDRARGGLGIGLTLCKALVEMHGGDISAASEGVGHGTAMTVRLPLSAAAPVTAPVTAPAPVAAAPAVSVLVVDDNADGREMLRALCELLGHEVVEAADGEAGVAQAIEHRPDIAFIDIGLPTIDGYEVARRVRAALGKAPRLVALSGYGSPQHRAAALEAGFDIHIAKPIDSAQLRRELDAASRPS